ncbi:MFS transporter [Sporomusa sp.]|uniref:MFS transporter n=1 Tax=Sporomusa sp. TaxID=2078658 RepID=UPI002CD439B6|nr:MFS transporter [Sporomusa sp.]HWR08991.1 MFS transporter [Sporomusa sp.]
MDFVRQKVIVGLSIWLYWFSLSTYIPILPTYAKDLGASYQMIGVILGSYGLTQVLLRLPLGIISDRLDRRKVFLITGTILGLAGSLGMWLFRDIYCLLFFRLLSGIAATAWVLQTVFFVHCYPSAEGGKAMGLVNAIVNSGEMSAMFAGGLVAQYYGQEQSFLLAALIALPALVCNWVVREVPAQTARESVSLGDIVAMARDWSLALPSLLGMVIQVISFGTVFSFVPLVAKNLGASYTEIGLLPMIYLLPGIMASLLSATFFRRIFSERLMVTGGFLMMAAGCLVIPFVPDIMTLFVTQAIAGFARGLVFPILMSLGIRDIAGHRQATAMGFFQTIYGMGMLLGPLVVGAISGWAGMVWGFAFVGMAGVLGAGAAWAAVAVRRRPEEVKRSFT